MKVNVNHPSFISFLESITTNILSSIKIDDYFSANTEKKMAISFTVLNFLKNSAKVRASLTDTELKSFIVVLCKKNEEEENYEFAAVLNDVIKNFDIINKLSDTTKKPVKKDKKTDTTSPQSPQQ